MQRKTIPLPSRSIFVHCTLKAKQGNKKERKLNKKKSKKERWEWNKRNNRPGTHTRLSDAHDSQRSENNQRSSLIKIISLSRVFQCNQSDSRPFNRNQNVYMVLHRQRQCDSQTIQLFFSYRKSHLFFAFLFQFFFLFCFLLFHFRSPQMSFKTASNGRKRIKQKKAKIKKKLFYRKLFIEISVLALVAFIFTRVDRIPRCRLNIIIKVHNTEQFLVLRWSHWFGRWSWYVAAFL